MQARGDMHETAESSLTAAPVAFGVVSIVHVQPSALAGWLACAILTLAIPVKPSSKVNPPATDVACLQRWVGPDSSLCRLT